MRYCEKCGSEIPKGAKYCKKCGALLESDIREGRESHSDMKKILGGIAGGMVVAGIVVLIFFATGILGGNAANTPGRDEETIRTSTGGMQSDPGTSVSEATAQPTEQPTKGSTAALAITSDQASANSVNVIKEVKKIRKLYYKTQNNLDSYMTGSELEGSTYYYEGGWPAKISIREGYNDWKYSREYFYHNCKLYFAFVYKGDEEHRLYFKNGKLIRYINEKGKTYDYGNNELSSFSELKDRVQSESTEIYPEILNCGN